MQSIIGGSFGLVVAAVIVWSSFVHLKNISKLKSWKTTGGKVVERGTFRITHATRSAPAFQHAPLVRYVYQADGQEYTGDAILPRHIQHPEHHTVEWAQTKAASFPDDLTVYYNPENPSETFLVPVPRKTIYIMLAAGSTAGLISLSLLIIGIGQMMNSDVLPASE